MKSSERPVAYEQLRKKYGTPKEGAPISFESPMNPPYFFKEKSWTYRDEMGEWHIREDAPEKAKESFVLYYEGYYDTEDGVNAFYGAPLEYQLSLNEVSQPAIK